jgi:hypothetical protein
MSSEHVHLETATGARTFLSAASFEGSPKLGNGEVVIAFETRCGQECPRSGGSGGVEMRPYSTAQIANRTSQIKIELAIA